MSKDNEHKNSSEEVDLGQLFKLIGNGIRAFFDAVGRFLKALLDLFVQCLLFIRRHLIKFVISIVVGIILGLFLDHRQATLYRADLIVEPNFGSTQQLYKNIQYYNSLIVQGDTLLLATTFDITSEEAKSLQGFDIQPIQNENSTLEVYNKLFRQSSDSALPETYTYDDFKNNISDYDYRIHNISVIALKNDVFRKLQGVIITSVKENIYFNTKKEVMLENLNRNSSILRQSIAEIDSLRTVYMRVLLAESKKGSPQGGTSIILSENTKRTNELELFNTKLQFKNELNDNEIRRAENSEVLNVISNFQPIGYRVNILYKKYYFIFAIAGFLLMFLYLVFRDLNTFLNAYQTKNEVKY